MDLTEIIDALREGEQNILGVLNALTQAEVEVRMQRERENTLACARVREYMDRLSPWFWYQPIVLKSNRLGYLISGNIT